MAASSILLITLVAVCFGVFGYLAGTRSMLIAESRELIARSAAYQQNPETPSSTLLIIGDSTAVGTGALPEESVAGLLGADFPQVAIENLAENGATVSAVQAQLSRAAQPSYDRVLVHAGANDILRFRRAAHIEHDLRVLFEAATERSEQVLFLTAGNIGGAPIFFPPLSTWYTHQTRAVRARSMIAAAEYGVAYVDLFIEPDDDPFLQDPWRYHAADGLHPSAAGYRSWYERIRDLLETLPRPLRHD